MYLLLIVVDYWVINVNELESYLLQKTNGLSSIHEILLYTKQSNNQATDKLRRQPNPTNQTTNQPTSAINQATNTQI